MFPMAKQCILKRVFFARIYCLRIANKLFREYVFFANWQKWVVSRHKVPKNAHKYPKKSIKTIKGESFAIMYFPLNQIA